MTVDKLIRIQGACFCVIAVSLVIICFLSLLDLSAIPIVFLVLVTIFLGMPHGAIDTLYAQHIYGCRTLSAWLNFTVSYLGLASMMVGLWLTVPNFFLFIFLFISVIHFSGDPDERVSKMFRLAYGGSAIVLPALIHETTIAQLFAALVNEPSAIKFARYFHLLAYSWLAFVIWAAISHAKNNIRASYELIAVATLTTLLTPLLGFTVFFCFMHSARHILRTIPIALTLDSKRLKLTLGLPMVATVVGLGLAWFYLPKASLDTKLLQWLFVSLAALTVPHMLLVDRLRFLGKSNHKK